jgi:hypothetical protein
MPIEQRRQIAAQLNQIPFIFMTRYPDDQQLKNVILQLEIEKKLFWNPWKCEWVAE